MARSSFGVFLMHYHASGNKWLPLIQIKSFPDLGGDPTDIEVTSTGDFMRQFIGGLEETQAMTFTANYERDGVADGHATLNVYALLESLEGRNERYAIWLGYTGTKENPNPDGHDGKFSFDGELYVYVNGGGIGEVVNMTVTIMPTSVIEYE